MGCSDLKKEKRTASLKMNCSGNLTRNKQPFTLAFILMDNLRVGNFRLYWAVI